MRIIAIAAALLAFASPALANPPIWSGVYIGVNGGYNWGGLDGDLTYTDPSYTESMKEIFASPSQTIDLDGLSAGGQIGLNIQTGAIVWGVEADANWADINGGDAFLNDGGKYGFKDMTWAIDTSIESYGTIRARAGYLVAPTMLLYATGGAAWGKVEATEVVAYNGIGPPVVGAAAEYSETLWGWTVGGGAEFKLSGNWSIKAEYLYVDLGEADYDFKGTNYNTNPTSAHTTDSFPADLDFHTARVGINYRFGQ